MNNLPSKLRLAVLLFVIVMRGLELVRQRRRQLQRYDWRDGVASLKTSS